METTRLDAISKSLASRLSRRTALQASGLGLAAGVLATTSRAASAQDAPSTPDPLGDDSTFLFVQSATSGTFAPNPGAGTPTAADGTPTPGGGADYLLTLEGHTGNTVYFSDRPERIFGTAPTDQFLDGLGFSPTNPPNAALVTNDESGSEDILVVELIEPSFDATSGSVTYGVNILSDYEGGLDFVAGRQQDEDLPPAFGAASLFIDDCPDLVGCFDNHDNRVGPLPAGYRSAMCWSWSQPGCEPCSGQSRSDYDNACNAAYPNCRNTCNAGS